MRVCLNKWCPHININKNLAGGRERGMSIAVFSIKQQDTRGITWWIYRHIAVYCIRHSASGNIQELLVLFYFYFLICTCHTCKYVNVISVLWVLCRIQVCVKLLWIAIHNNIKRSDANNTLALNYSCAWTAITWFVAMEMWHVMATHIAQDGEKKRYLLLDVYDNRDFKDTLLCPVHKEKD